MRPTRFDAITAYAKFDWDELMQEGVGGGAFTLLVGFEVQRDGNVRRFRLLDERDGAPRIMSETINMQRVPQKPPRVVLAAGADVPVLRLDFKKHVFGTHGESHYDVRTVFDFRAAAPRMAVVRCWTGWAGGACGAHDLAYAPRGGTRCAWSDEHADFVCDSRLTLETETRGVLRATRRHTLLGNRILPSRGSISSIGDLKDRAGDARVTVDGIGTLEWIFTASTPGGEVRSSRSLRRRIE